MMKITKVNHIGIAVSNLEEALKLYTVVLGLKVKGTEIVAEQKVRTALIPVGDTKIELLESTDPEGTIAKHIEKRGEGLHHLAFEVTDINESLEELKSKGIVLID